MACWVSYSYSEPFTYGATGNAASDALRWSMANVLPDEAGLEVSGVIYQYRANKKPSDDMIVNIQNERKGGTGYIFRESDDWSGKPGNVINKAVPVDNVHISQWGDGSIEVEGEGTVSEASVVYTYRVDPCYDPQSSPSCEGYVAPMPDLPPPVDVYNALDDELVANATKETDRDLLEEEEAKEEEEQEEEEEKESLEDALSAERNALTLANQVSQASILQAMNLVAGMASYYQAQIQGGTYEETVTLKDTDLPDNPQGLRNGLAQQLLHEKMVDMQY